MFATGFIAGSQYVRLLAQLAAGNTPPAIVSVGKTDDGTVEVEVFAAPGEGSIELHDAAYDHVAERGYAYAAIVCAHPESIALFVLAPGAPDQMVLRVTELVEVDGTQIKTSEPEIFVAGEDVDVAAFLEGFHDAIVAEALSFTLERGALGPFPNDDAGDARMFETGHIAGRLLAENLINLADGVLPLNSPCGGAERKRGEDKFGLVHFPEGMTPVVQRWLSRTDLEAGVLVQHREDVHEVRLLVPACDGTEKLDFVCAIRYAAEAGAVKTSLPGYQLFGVEQAVYDQFMDGVGAGMSEHKRANELDAGFGALGDYR